MEENREEAFPDLDPAFAERDRCRRAGIPVKIAKTRRLLIRETVMEDVPKLYGIGQQPGAGDYMEPMQPTLEEETEFMKAYIDHAYAFYDFGLWTVVERESGEVIGRAGLFPTKILEEGVELGYLIAADRQRRGYAVECGAAILSYASEVLDLSEIHAVIDKRNLPSIRTAGKLGFTGQKLIRSAGKEYVHMVWRS